MNLVETIILSFFDIIAIYIVMFGLLHEKKPLGSLFIYGVLFEISSATLAYMINIDVISIILNSILMTLMIIVIYRKSIVVSIYLYIISSVIILVIQLGIITVSGFFIKEFQFSFIYGVLSQSIGVLLIVLITRILPLKVMYNFLEQNNKVFKQIMISAFIMLFTILVYWYLNFDGIIENVIIIMITVVLLLFVNLVVIRNGLINEFTAKELLIYKTYNPIIEELIDEIRSRQHDFDNHLQAINILISNLKPANNSHITNYIKELKIKNNLGDLIKLESKLVASMLFSKKRLAEQKNIPFEIDIKEYSFNTSLKEAQIVEMIAILLDNAIETEIDYNEIFIKIYKEKNRDIILVRNKHPHLPQEILNNMLNKGYSAKGERNKGYGLYNLRKIISEGKGEIIIKNEQINNENYVAFKLLF